MKTRAIVAILALSPASAFKPGKPMLSAKAPVHMALGAGDQEPISSRRSLFKLSSALLLLRQQQPAFSADFAPGGTMVDYKVGPLVGNADASPSRNVDNSNVLFVQDYYFKFGTAPPWIVDDTFPKTMPFTPSKQRYEALKKYRDRVQRGVDLIANKNMTLDANAPEYSIRPMGLLANSFMASENTGTTNELFLCRWYINEIYLQIGDYQRASSTEAARQSYASAVAAVNSYLRLLNRVMTPKVGESFQLIQVQM
jgi:hypothetical protein